jgi:hypothetical protein
MATKSLCSRRVSASKLALLLHLGLTQVSGVKREGSLDDGGDNVDEPLDDLVGLVKAVLQ